MSVAADQAIKILAVDDEAMNNELLQRTFRPHPQYALHVVKTGQEALDYFNAGNEVHVLLVDQSMPGMSGAELVRTLFNKGHRPQVVMVTAFPELKEVVAMWQEGLVRGIVPKPWRAIEIIRAVERFAAKRASAG